MPFNESFKGMITVSGAPSIKSSDGGKSFDTSTALAGLYLWLLFGFFSPLISCDLQRVISKNMYTKHLVAFITFFFLLTVIDNDNDSGILVTWIKTFIVYILFLMSTKSQLLASGTVLALLIVDQTIKLHMQYTLKHTPGKDLSYLQNIRENLFKILILVIGIGYIHYFIQAYTKLGNNFSYSKFIFGSVHCFHHDYIKE